MAFNIYLPLLTLPFLYCNGLVLNWTLTSSRLPAKTKAQMGGYCNITNKIWLFGGVQDSVVWSYDITSSSVDVYTSSSVPFPAYIGPTSPLENGYMYWNYEQSPYISRFSTQHATFYYHYLQHPKSYQNFRIALNNNILFLLGGSSTNEFHLLDLHNTSNWYTGMNYTVNNLGRQPVITSNYLYKVFTNGIEYVSISGTIDDIISRDWIFITKNLQNRYTAGPVVHNIYSKHDEIWLIGGYITYALNDVFAIDIDSDSFIVSKGNSPTTIADAVGVYVPYLDIIYVLGGLCDECGGQTNYIYKVNYWTETIGPTKTPSVIPTANPTLIPTSFPTIFPTIIPTLIPTKFPTLSPTAEPTVIPTLFPTLIPTENPSKTPICTPTSSPTLKEGENIEVTTSSTHVYSTVVLISREHSFHYRNIIIESVVAAALCIVFSCCIFCLNRYRYRYRQKQTVELGDYYVKMEMNNVEHSEMTPKEGKRVHLLDNNSELDVIDNRETNKGMTATPGDEIYSSDSESSLFGQETKRNNTKKPKMDDDIVDELNKHYDKAIITEEGNNNV
eukprot:69902_1